MTSLSLIVKAVSPGRAELHIQPWSREPEGIELSILRNAEPPHLDPASRQWVGEQQWIQLQGARTEDTTLIMPVGAAFVDTLLGGTNGPRCQARVRVGSEAMKCSMRIEPGVLLSSAAGEAPTTGGSSQMKAPAAQPAPSSEPAQSAAEAAVPQSSGEAAHESSAVAAESQPPQATGASSRSGIWLAVAVLALAAIGAGVYYFLAADEQATAAPAAEGAETAAPSAATNEAAGPAAAAPGCNIDSLGKGDAMAFVQTCVRDVTDSGALLQIIQAARQAGQCEIAQRLYANRANAGDIQIALAYAKEYDPATYSENACFKPESATARYWYEMVLEKDGQHAEAKTRLQALAA